MWYNYDTITETTDNANQVAEEQISGLTGYCFFAVLACAGYVCAHLI